MNEFRPERLSRLRAERGWSLREAAKATGGTKETINDLERGKRTPHPATLRKLADGFGVSVTYFLEPTAPKAQSRPLPEAPNQASEEERTIARRVSPEELEQQISLMKELEEKRERQIARVKETGVLEPAWIFGIEADDHYLAHLHETEGFTAFVEEVNEGRMMTSDEMRELCLAFSSRFSALQSLTKKARLVEQRVKGSRYVKIAKFRAALDASSLVHHTEVSE